MVKVTYYFEAFSSWCHWVEPAWAALKERYAANATFDWKIALMPPEVFPASSRQADWFYQRSGTMMRSPYKLNSGWVEANADYRAANLVAEAARDLGITDDRARLAVMHAALREGRKVGRWPEAVAAVAGPLGLDAAALQARAQSPEVLARVEASTAEFHAMRITQRPAFLMENALGDRAIFSGVVRFEALAAGLQALADDEAAAASFNAHFGQPPAA